MAPPTGPANGTKRGGAPRGRGRGGIAKRRSDRVDRDGDVSMDPTAPNGPRNPRGRGASRAVTRASTRLAAKINTYGPDGSKKHLANIAKVKVYGVKQSKAASNADGGEKSLVMFIEKKGSRQPRQQSVKVIKSAPAGDYFFLGVDKQVLPEVLKLNGFDFAGHPILITETDEPWPTRASRGSVSTAPTPATQSLKEDLRMVLASRYNAETRLLDLSALGTDPILVAKGLFQEQATALKAFGALMVVASECYKSAQEKKEGIQLVSLASNGLTNVGDVFDVARHFPGILGLDLSNNQIEKLPQLAKWRHYFNGLAELRLAGNPIVLQESNLEQEMKSWFPKLRQLDDKQVRTPEEIVAQAPVPIPQVGFDFRDVNNLGEHFLREFFALYDTDRGTLTSKFYDEESMFSLAVVAASGKASDEAVLPWKPYLRFSRNLQFFGPRNAENRRRLLRGQQIISEAWQQLPVTKHAALEESDKWILDAHVVNNLADPSGMGAAVDGLIVTVNGEFEEAADGGKTGRRSFSRHFVLGPAKPGRGTIRVVSDQLTLRAHQSLEKTTVEAPLPPKGLDEISKQQMVKELSDRTGMTLQFSELCLAGKANWHFHLALRSFEELKHTLGPDAFLPGAQPAAVQPTAV